MNIQLEVVPLRDNQEISASELVLWVLRGRYYGDSGITGTVTEFARLRQDQAVAKSPPARGPGSGSPRATGTFSLAGSGVAGTPSASA